MSFIVGSNSCDFNEVKQHTEYLNGYAQDHASIDHFWRVVTEFPTDAKKKLLGVCYYFSNNNNYELVLFECSCVLIQCIIVV